MVLGVSIRNILNQEGTDMPLIPKFTNYQQLYTSAAILHWKYPVYVYRNRIFKHEMWVTTAGYYHGPEADKNDFKLAFIIKPKNKQ